MPLRSPSNVPAKRIRPETYQRFEDLLDPQEIDAIIDGINKHIDGKSHVKPKQICGKIWDDTPYQKIYDKACNQSQMQSAMMFGVVVWYVFMDRDEEWVFQKPEQDDDIQGMFYFQPQN